LIITPGLDLNDIFVGCLKDDAKWQQLINAGAITNFYAALGVDQVSPPQWATVAYAWKQHIILWAPAMHSAAQALETVLKYLAQHPGLDPLHDGTFLEMRKIFASQLKAAVEKTHLFDDALGVITIHLAAPPANETVVLRYADETKTYSRTNGGS